MMDCWNGLGAGRRAGDGRTPHHVRPSGRRQRKTPVAHTFLASPRVLVFLAPAPRKKLGRLCHTAVLPLGLPSRWLSLVRDEGAQIWGQQRGKGRAACNVPGITGEYGIIPQRKGRGVGVSSRCGHEVSVLLGSPGQHRHHGVHFRVPSEELSRGGDRTAVASSPTAALSFRSPSSTPPLHTALCTGTPARPPSPGLCLLHLAPGWSGGRPGPLYGGSRCIMGDGGHGRL